MIFSSTTSIVFWGEGKGRDRCWNFLLATNEFFQKNTSATLPGVLAATVFLVNSTGVEITPHPRVSRYSLSKSK